MQCPTEIEKHFKIVFTRFTVRVSWRKDVLTKAVTFQISRHGAMGSKRTCVCSVELFIRTGSVIKLQCGFHHEMRRHVAPSPKAFCRWVRPWREEGSVARKSHLVGAALISHNLEHCPSVGVCRPQSEAICRFARSGVRHVWQECSALPAYWPESSSIQAANSHSLSDRDSEVRLQVYSLFQAILSENPDLPNNLLMSDEAHFLLQVTVNPLAPEFSFKF
jgi:hypothetical protein